jgi:hypothetical protein
LRKVGSGVARSLALVVLCFGLSGGAGARAAGAQESPFFITYDDHLEELGNLEIAVNPLLATQRPPAVGLAKGRADRGVDGFLAASAELEYGVKGWWTAELYLDGQTTRGDSTVLTGWRWENRWRPLLREHRINPVLYVELEDIDATDKTMLEVVGHDVESDHATPNREARRERLREAETKLILASHVADWNLAGNFIAEKNLAGPVWEFGYALGASRPLALAALPYPCTLCAENFTAGVEMYGGLGDARAFGLRDTSHYLAAVLSWNLPSGTTLRLSPTFGLNANSHRFLLRLGISHEISDVARRVRQARRKGAT